MNRITKKIGYSDYSVTDSDICKSPDGYIGGAISRLGSFEDFYFSLLEKQEALCRDIELLKTEDKTKTVKFRESLAKKLMNSNLLSILESYGIK